MLLQPDPTTAFIDPFMAHKTLVMIADIKDPVTKEFYSRDPRGIAKKAEAYLKSSGIGDTAYFGPEAEFFVFDNVQYGTGQQYSSYSVDSREGHWNTNRDEGPNLGYKIRPKEGYFPCPPNDTLQDLRAEMALTMIEIGLTIECQHHEVATAGQAEIDMKFDSLLAMADHQMKYKYVVRNVAAKHGKTATFMPKPLYGDNGSGMHCHQSIWKAGKPLFADATGYAGLSQMCKWYIGGLLRARAGDPRLRRADHQQLPPPGARLRGAGQPRLVTAQSIGLLAGFRCTATVRRPSGSSSAARTRRATPTSLSPPC